MHVITCARYSRLRRSIVPYSFIPTWGTHLCCDGDAVSTKRLRPWTRLAEGHDCIRSWRSCWLSEAVPHRGWSLSHGFS
jgi:hypothetical protein